MPGLSLLFDEYGLRHLPRHLTKVERWYELSSLLRRADFLDAKSSMGDIYSLLEDYLLALETIPDANLLEMVERIYHLVDSKAHLVNDSLLGRLRTFFLQELYNGALVIDDQDIAEQTATLLGEGGIWVRSASLQRPNIQVERILGRHSSVLMAAAFSPDSSILATGGFDGKIRLFDVRTGRILGEVDGHSRNVEDLVFVSHGILASAGWDCKIRLWDTQNLREIRCLSGPEDIVRCVAVSPDGQQLAAGSADRALYLWSMTDYKPVAKLEEHTAPLHSVAYSHDGKFLASAGYDKDVVIWDPATLKPYTRLTGHTGYIWQIAFGPDDEYLASASIDHTIRIWNWRKGEESSRLEGFKSMMASIAFSPDGKWLAAGGSEWDENQIIVWDAQSLEEACRMVGHTLSIWKVIFSNDSSRLASVASDRTARVWDMRRIAGEPMYPERHQRRVIDVKISQNAHIALSTPVGRKEIWIWDTRDRKVLRRLSSKTGFAAMNLSFDGDKAVTYSRDEALQIWDVLSGNELGRIPSEHNISAVSFDPAARLIAGMGDGRLSIWNVDSKDLLSQLNLLFETSLAFSADGNLIAVGGPAGQINVWSHQPRSLLHDFSAGKSAIRCLTFSPDNKYLAAGSEDSHVYLYNLSDGSTKVLAHARWVSAVAFLSGGKILSSSGWDQIVKFWDVETGGLTAAGYVDNAVSAIQVEASSNTIYIADYSRTPNVYEMKLMGGGK